MNVERGCFTCSDRCYMTRCFTIQPRTIRCRAIPKWVPVLGKDARIRPRIPTSPSSVPYEKSETATPERALPPSNLCKVSKRNYHVHSGTRSVANWTGSSKVGSKAPRYQNSKHEKFALRKERGRPQLRA